MKNQWKGFLTGVLTTLLLFTLIGGAAATIAQREAVLYYNDVKIEVDGKPVTPKDEKGNVVEPFAVDGTNYLPIRAIANALGLDVEWVQETKTVKLTSKAAQPISSEKKEFSIGETWTVPGQWSVTVTGVTETKDRNEFSDKKPGAVYVVDYTYTNLGYEDSIFDGLFISLDDTIVDSTGIMGYSYPGDITNYAQETPVGATCKAQVCIGVETPGNFKISISKYDGTDTKQSATFNIAVK